MLFCVWMYCAHACGCIAHTYVDILRTRMQLDDDGKTAAMRIFREQRLKTHADSVSVAQLLPLLQEEPRLREALRTTLGERLRAQGNAKLTQSDWSALLDRKAELQIMQVRT